MRLDLFCHAFTPKHVCALREMQWIERKHALILALASQVAFLFNTQKLFLSKSLLCSDVVLLSSDSSTLLGSIKPMCVVLAAASQWSAICAL